MRMFIWLALAFAALAAGVFWYQVIDTPSRRYHQLEKRAEQEGMVVIYSVTDRAKAEPIINAFEAQYPQIRVDYHELPAEGLYKRAVNETDSQGKTADLLWSSAMDLQVKFTNDGYALTYASPAKPNLPDWAVWQDEAYGTTAEPIVFAFNRKVASELELPQTHADFRRFLDENRQILKGKVATYDPKLSAAGYLYLSQDDQVYRDTWSLVRAMAATDVRLYDTTADILAGLSTGELAAAFNIVGSYALEAQRNSSEITIVFPKDYTLVMSRIAVIPRAARHPAAGKVFLDFLLSVKAQRILAEQYMVPVRTDVPLPARIDPIPGSARAIRVGPGLLVTHDRLSRKQLLENWDSALDGH